ncbi:MAG: hypothetical protein ACODAA_04495 [Gemmatimonadota bacterium]
MTMRDWPDWLESLRPDDVTAARLRREITSAAGPLLDARREDWWDVASGWAGLLTPVAAVLALVFAGLALSQGADGRTVAAVDLEPAADVVEALRSETAPAGFSEFEGADHDIVFAALGETPRSNGAAPAPGESP